MDTNDVLLVEQLGRIRRLTLNRPEKRNALNAELTTRLFDEVEAAGADDDTSVVVLRGAGTCFSAGADLSAHGTKAQVGAASDFANTRAGAENMRRLWNCPIPIIAQVHGWCLATATDIVFSCDLILAAESAQFGHPGVRTQGTPPTNQWLYYGGPQIAKWLLLTGGTISGIDAARRGLVLSAHAEAELEDAVMAAAGEVAKVVRDMLVINKAVLNHGLDLMGRSQLQTFAAAQNAIGHTSSGAAVFRARVAEIGLTGAVAERDAAFDSA